ncbi:MAG: ABC transporter ATP-binding protein [Pararhodobacter sp.]|nr:ABC transporter ATP-binding protein [Pararhodobacter sp.]
MTMLNPVQAQTGEKANAIEVRDLVVRFPVRGGLLRREIDVVRAVDGVSFDVREGETVGLVGESGSGKTTTGRALLGLSPANPGSVRLFGRSLEALKTSGHDLQKLGQLVFQDPFASLNPRLAIGAAISEALYVHGMKDKSARQARMIELLDQVGLRPEIAARYPVALSGGQRQRVAIARALAVEPRIMILDEVVSALDVSIQGQILNLLMDLQEAQNLSFLFITHDLSVVRYVSHRVVVMYRGCLMEEGETESVFQNPKHPYTHSLLSAVPVPDPVLQREKRKKQIQVETQNLTLLSTGCRFQGSCPHADDMCRVQEPEMREVSENHRVACHHYAKIPDFVSS